MFLIKQFVTITNVTYCSALVITKRIIIMALVTTIIKIKDKRYTTTITAYTLQKQKVKLTWNINELQLR